MSYQKNNDIFIIYCKDENAKYIIRIMIGHTWEMKIEKSEKNIFLFWTYRLIGKVCFTKNILVNRSDHELSNAYINCPSKAVWGHKNWKSMIFDYKAKPLIVVKNKWCFGNLNRGRSIQIYC